MDLVDFWRYIKDGGPMVILLLLAALWWLNEQRKLLAEERDQLQKQKDALTERLFTVTQDAVGAIRELREMLFIGREKSK